MTHPTSLMRLTLQIDKYATVQRARIDKKLTIQKQIYAETHNSTRIYLKV